MKFQIRAENSGDNIVATNVINYSFPAPNVVITPSNFIAYFLLVELSKNKNCW